MSPTSRRKKKEEARRSGKMVQVIGYDGNDDIILKFRTQGNLNRAWNKGVKQLNRDLRLGDYILIEDDHGNSIYISTERGLKII